MTELLTSGPSYFPGWVSILFSVGLGLGIVHHLPCLIRGHGNRWFHAGHAAMAVSMIYMFLSMSYDWTWLPAAWQMWFFVVTSALVVGYLVTKVVRRQPANLLWILLFVQQAAMAYMWFPMMRWNAIVIFALVSWFAIEAFGWAADLLPDQVRRRSGHVWLPYELGATAVRVSEVRATTQMTVGAGVRPGSGRQDLSGAVDVVSDCHTSASLVTSHWKDRTLMAIMALSMGYMFYGMELMRWMPAAVM